jgi:hypothetical protein
MRMQRRYYELNAEDRKVYTAWLRKIIALWALIFVAVVGVCTVLSLDASMTTAQRIAPLQQAGVFP